MKLWTIAGFITGLVLVSLIARKCKYESVFMKHTDKRYYVDDFLADQEL